jgi:DNA-binding Lrp family transcriptional regulator
MRPLTSAVWRDHFTQLRPYVLQEFPEVDREKLERCRDDFSAVVAVVHKDTGVSADEVERRLKTLDVEELGLGTGAAEA